MHLIFAVAHLGKRTKIQIKINKKRSRPSISFCTLSHYACLSVSTTPGLTEVREQVTLLRKHLAIVMEYAQGGDLYKYVLRQRPATRLQESHARWIFQQLIIGVDYCHRMVGWQPLVVGTLYCSTPRSIVRLVSWTVSTSMLLWFRNSLEQCSCQHWSPRKQLHLLECMLLTFPLAGLLLLSSGHPGIVSAVPLQSAAMVSSARQSLARFSATTQAIGVAVPPFGAPPHTCSEQAPLSNALGPAHMQCIAQQSARQMVYAS